MNETDLSSLQKEVQRERSARKEAERLLDERSRELSRAGQQLQRYLDTMQTVMVAMDLEGRITMINRAGCELLGRSESELIGQEWASHFTSGAADAAIVSDVIKGLAAGGLRPGNELAEFAIIDSQGRERHIAWRRSPLTDSASRIVGILSSGEDITERKLAEASIAESRNLLVRIIDTVPVRIFWKDRNLRYLGCNTLFARDAGKTCPEELVGKDVYQMDWADRGDTYNADDLAVMESGVAKLFYEQPQTMPSGQTIWVRKSKIPLKNQNDETIGVLGVYEDITELRRSKIEVQEKMLELTALNTKLVEAQNQLLQAEKLASVGQLAAGVAHEINNPIGFINSNLGTLKRQIEDLLSVIAVYETAEAALSGSPGLLESISKTKLAVDLEFLREDIPKLIAESLDGVHRVKKIVDNLKDFSRVDSTEWHYANLEDGLESTLTIVWNEIKYKAEVIKEYAGLPEIDCIAAQLNQVFMNLLVNAAQAIEERGTITLRTGFDENNVWVEIADTGKGIKPEHLNKIFEPFFTTKPVGKGTGLGLSLAYSIVQSHHGQLDVRSEPGKGSVFRLTLPRQRSKDDTSV